MAVKSLFDSGADVNALDSWGRTPLSQAARHWQDGEVVKLLLEKTDDREQLRRIPRGTIRPRRTATSIRKWLPLKTIN